MRINGFEQIKGFYSWMFSHQEKDIKPQHMSLYMFLVNQNNRNNWVEWFKVPYDLGMSGSCISSKKTYYNCMNDLQDWKLIKYEKGVNNWKAPRVKIEVLKDTATVPQSEPLTTPLGTPPHILLLLQAAEPLPIHNIKPLTSNLKLITDNIQQVISFVNNLNPFEQSEISVLAKSELINALVLEFGFSEHKFSQQRSIIMSFVTNLEFTDMFSHFIEQFKNYKLYKTASKEKTHSFESLIGTPAMKFDNAAWNKENWANKLLLFKSDPSNQSKFEKLKNAYDAPNPYLNNDGN